MIVHSRFDQSDIKQNTTYNCQVGLFEDVNEAQVRWDFRDTLNKIEDNFVVLCLILITKTKKTGCVAENECNDERMLNVLKNDKFESILTQHGTFSIVKD